MKDNQENYLNAYLAGIEGLNEHVSNTNKGLPNDSMKYDIAIQPYKFQFEKEIKLIREQLKSPIMNQCLQNGLFSIGNHNAYNQAVGIIYQIYNVAIGYYLDISPEFMEDLGLEKYRLIRYLIDNGSLAYVVDDGEAYLLPFTVGKQSVYESYKQSNSIKINTPNNKYWNNKEFVNTTEKHTFEVWQLNAQNWNDIVENSTFIYEWLKAGMEGSQALSYAKNKYIYGFSNSDETEAETQADMIDKFMKSPNLVLPWLIKGQDSGHTYLGTTPEKPFNMAQKLAKIEGNNVIHDLWQAQEARFAKIFQWLGLYGNAMPNKNDRGLNGDLNNQNDLPNMKRALYFQQCEDFIKRVNKTFSKNYTVTLHAQTPLDSSSEVIKDPTNQGGDKDEPDAKQQ